jgi:mRNA interferase MazF
MSRRGDLLLVPFPFTDLSATKRRPVLALTDADSYGDFVALPVTCAPAGRTWGVDRRRRYAHRQAAGTELDSHQSDRHAQHNAGGQAGRHSGRTHTVDAAVARFCAYIGRP